MLDVASSMLYVLSRSTHHKGETMKKSEVERSYHRGSQGLPMLNVKHYGRSDYVSAVQERFKCSEPVAEQALEYAYESAVERFWNLAKDDVDNVFGSRPKLEVYSEGRSGGWLVVQGLPNVETWDAIQLGKWAQYAKYIRETIKWLASAEEILDAIESNRWAEEGAELYNFQDTPAG